MANSVDPDQTAPLKDPDQTAPLKDPDQTAPLSLHCLPRPICLKTSDHYGKL